MKKIYLPILFFLLSLSLAYSQGSYTINLGNRNINFLPDVMNKVNVSEQADGKIIYKTIDADSFPSFTGFPKHISGSTFEGAIYCNMDSDPEMEIVVNIGFTVQAFNLDGSNVPGWPQTVPTYALEGAPAFGDIDGDGQGEIVVTNHGLTSGGFIFAFRKNGTAVTGFPINHGYSSRTPVLADVDNNGSMEIIVNKRLSSAGEVYIYKGDATIYAGWPKSINHVPASSSAVGDITGDGVPEIISESYSSLYAWAKDGNIISGFPFTMPNGDVNSYSAPVLADVDNDNSREIIFGTHLLGGGGYVYIIKNNGTVLTGWPKSVGQWIYGPPAVGYIDGDNIMDIAVGDQVLSGIPSDYINAWNKNGTALTGFPIGPLNAINNQIILGDIDNDNSTELIADDNTQTGGIGQYIAYNHDGTPLAGWPINTAGTTFFCTPSLGDFNWNGILDIEGCGVESSPSYTNVYAWNTGINYNSSKIYIPMWQFNARHSGVYGDIPVGVNTQNNNVPASFALHQNYPNPFNPSTVISFDLPRRAFVKLNVYDMLGREIAVLMNGEMNAGSHSFTFKGEGLSSGMYFYKIETNGFSDVKKMMLVK
jgi:hypothetical protein